MIAGREQAEDETHIIDEVLDDTVTPAAQPHVSRVVGDTDTHAAQPLSEPVVLELNQNFVDFEEVVERDDVERDDVGTSTQQVNEEEHVVDVFDFEDEEGDVASPIEPPVDMREFKFDFDPHFENLSKLAYQCMADYTDHDIGCNFEEFHSDGEVNASRLVNLRKIRLKEIRREYEGRSNVKKGEFFVTETFNRPKAIKQERIRAICRGTVVGYGRNNTGSSQPSASSSQSKGNFASSKTYKKKNKPMCPWSLHVSKVMNVVGV
ncbi:hypothetical protein CTI12_AA174410 [Artemisia annua]|uniref:Uncharacterized protein n=1 Tax=Artemisia annua TaxID=35608 RepID=A0A2U1PB11_ARTAN|nr:hypothetical protein CTI12_AA174410 [Artemisia annua]